MTVEINLLGKKEKRNGAPYVILAVFLLLALGLGLFGFMMQLKMSGQLAMLEQQLQSAKQLNQVYGQKANEAKSTTAVEDLEATIKWVETFPTPTVYLIRHLTSLLPERGFIMNFSYADDGSLTLTVQTDTSREIAYYLKYLTDSPFFTEVNLNSITTTPVNPVNDRNRYQASDNPNYLPRYTGQLQLKVNKGVLKEEAEKEGGI